MILDVQQVHRARAELFETGSVSEPLTRAVRPEILASWRRSAAFGAQPDLATLPYREDLSAAGRLMRAAEPVLRSLAESLTGVHAGVLLSDRDANILQRWAADSWILGALDRICSDAGFGAPEDRVGTNGIGTVAELGRAQLVAGPEHFADALVTFACVGTPIHHPTTRRLEGIVTLSCQADAANDLLLPLMMSTAADIEHRLLESATADERHVLDAYLAAKRRCRMIAAVGKDLLIAGPRATRLLDQLVDRDVLWDVVADVIVAAGATHRSVETSDGRTVDMTFTPISDGDRLVGAIVHFDEVPASAPVGPRARPRSTSEERSIDLPGDNAKWLAATAAAARYARDGVPVVIAGEPGVGKSAVVQAMLDLRAGRPVTSLDCRDLGDATELPTVGPADGIVLLHLGALSATTARRLAGWAATDPGTERRWVAATLTTDRDLTPEQARLVADLRAVTLWLPSLQQRPDDIPAIVKDLVAKHARHPDVRLSAEAVNELSRASWPGNIRQLEDVVRSVVALRVGDVTAGDLPTEVRSRSVRRSLTPIEQLECDAIIQALHAADGNKVAAAKTIGLSRSTIYRKMRAYGIDRESAFF